MARDQLIQVLDSALQQEQTRGGKIEPGTREAILKDVDIGYGEQDRALQILLITFIPPIVLLLLGVAIGWIIGGFRSKPA